MSSAGSLWEGTTTWTRRAESSSRRGAAPDLVTDEDGNFEVETVVPLCYGIPEAGATGRLMAALGRHCFRPGHIHFKVSAEGVRPLTTQVYFEGDPYLDSDVVGAVKDSLGAA